MPENLEMPVVSTNLTEILGALIENAVRLTRQKVRVVGISRFHITLSIENDGPGLSEIRAELAVTRGTRLDESGRGHGFGLAIARDHVEATEGEIELATSSAGGLDVRLRWRKPDR